MTSDFMRGPGPDYKPPRIEPDPPESVAERGRELVLEHLAEAGITKTEGGKWTVTEPSEET